MGNIITPPDPVPTDPDKRCGKCKWHFDLTGQTERDGVKNCLALPYPACTVTFSLPSAICNYQHLFELDPKCK